MSARRFVARLAAVVATAALALGLSATSASADELSQPFGGDGASQPFAGDLSQPFSDGLVPIDFVPIDFVPIDFVPIDFVPIDFVPIDFVPIDFVPISADGGVPISALALLAGSGSGSVPI